VAKRKNTPAGNASQITPEVQERPRIVLLHFTAPPIVGGVEAVIAEHIRLFAEAGYQTLIITGRDGHTEHNGLGKVKVIPEMDSENMTYLGTVPAIESGEVPEEFRGLQTKIQSRLARALRPTDVVIAHNILTTDFNLALTAAVHGLAEHGEMEHLIVWCHDISKHVNPEREAAQYHGFPWDLLRTRIRSASYVAVSSARQQALAGILGCPAETIKVVPNGVDAGQLLGLSPLGARLIEEYGLFSADLILLMPVRITRAKNIEFALQVAHAIKESGRTLRLVITGPPDPHAADIQDYYRGLVAQREMLGLHDDVIFVHEGTSGHPAVLLLDAAVVGELYRISDLILMPSLREGFGMPVLEAGLVDRPVFATSTPVTQELPEFSVLIGQEESAESVARRILQWADTDAAHRLRVEVRSHYTWSRIFERQIFPLVESVAMQGADV